MNKLEQLAKLIRYYILTSTTVAGSGHPTSSLSATDLMTVLMFGGYFKSFLNKSSHPNNDRLIFSKGHAAPLLYSLYAAAGKVSEKQLKTLRKFSSPLEGHPTKKFLYTEVATGSLGQGLSVGVGMAINAKYLDKLSYTTYVLLGDSEMAEGSNWEALQIASYYKLNNLVGIIDVNRLGQRGQTMLGHKVQDYAAKCKSFGWETVMIDGHNLKEIGQAFKHVGKNKKPLMIIAKTLKGKGVSFLEDQEGWHGKVLNNKELKSALAELGKVDKKLRGQIKSPKDLKPKKLIKRPKIELDKSYSQPLSTRKAYGHALVELAPYYPEMVVLDAEVSNSTYAEMFKQKYPKRFFEMFIAEQNMVGVAVGLSARGKIPFVSTFASFFTRAYDQIRVSQYSQANVNFVGSHVGVSIGEDGATQMGLEDMAIFRCILGSTVLYAADHVAEEKLVEQMIKQPGICYMRTTRMDTAPLYQPSEKFKIGGSKVLRQSKKDKITVVAAGVTLYETLQAYEQLKAEGISIRVIDLYSVKPIDKQILKKAVKETKALITVEDHFAEGGLGEAVMSALADKSARIYSLAVRKMPKSGQPQQLLNYENISSQAIIRQVKKLIK